MFLDRKDARWNADIDDKSLNENIVNEQLSTKHQLLVKLEIYILYRQSHYKVYVSPFSKYEEKSRAIAYSDIKKPLTII